MIEGISQKQIFGDELEVVVRAKNPTKFTQEFRASLFTNTDKFIDKEPDFSYLNVAPGATAQIRLTTVGLAADIDDLSPSYIVRLQSQNGEVSDAVIVDKSSGRIQHVSNAAIFQAASQTQESQGAQGAAQIQQESTQLGTLFTQNKIIPTGGMFSGTTGLILLGVIAVVVFMLMKKR